MPFLEVISLPLDPFLSTSHWAWLLALSLATLATFTRLSPSSFFMDTPPLSSFISSRHVRRTHLQPTTEEAFSSDEEHTTNKLNESVCEKQTGSEKEIPWSFLQLQKCGAGEEDEVVKEEEDDQEVLPSSVSSLQEASRTHPEASRNHLEASIPALEGPTAYTSCVQARSWSQSLHRQISACAGIQWHCTETRMGMPLHHQARLPCVAEALCTQNVQNMWSCQELQRLQRLQISNALPAISAVEVDIHDGFAHLGYHDGEIALWDLEKRVCLNRLRNRESHIAALFSVPSYPRVAIATGWSVHNQNCSIVSVWDERCTLQSAGFSLSMPASWMKSLKCRAHELDIVGEGYVLRHDLRMLKGNPIMIYTAKSVQKSARGGGQGENMRGPNHEVQEDKSVHEGREEVEAAEYMVMDKISNNCYDGNYASSKRRYSFLSSCLSFVCCLVQNP